eukprot:1087305-Karenia_brevis.AAC.1
MLEHPQVPVWTSQNHVPGMDAALCNDVISSFCTDQSRFIASLPGAGHCNIEQCSLGQCALKPTRLLH